MKGILTTKNKSYFFKAISDNDEITLSDYLEIPFNLYYDSLNFDEGMKGGVFKRNNLFFVVRIPFIDQIKEIKFFKRNLASQINKYSSTWKQFSEEEATFLGVVSLRSYLPKDGS